MSSGTTDRPRLRRGHKRGLGQPLHTELAQCSALIRIEAGDVGTRPGDAERERLPPVLEPGVLDLYRDGSVDDVVDSSRAKEVGQLAAPATREDRPGLDLRIERLSG